MLTRHRMPFGRTWRYLQGCRASPLYGSLIKQSKNLWRRKDLRVKVRCAKKKFARSALVINFCTVKCREHEFKLIGTRRGGERQIRMNEAKITVMARFTITVIETEICESPTLTAETSLERLPVSSFKPNPSYLPTNASTFQIIRYLTSTKNFTLASVLSCLTLQVLFSFNR